MYMFERSELERFWVREERYYDRFRGYLDKSGSIAIGSFKAMPSTVLEKVSLVSFKKQYIKWLDYELRHIFFIAKEYYPFPVAYFAFLILHGYDNYVHRLQLLRSLWESLIQLLFDITISEFRATGFAFKSVELSEGVLLKSSHCRTDSIGRRIDIMRSILRAVKKHLPIMSYLVRDEYIFERLFELNRLRNTMQHGYARSESESRDCYYLYERTVQEVLFDLAGLQDIRCMKFRHFNEEGEQVYAEFRGFSGMGQDIISGE